MDLIAWLAAFKNTVCLISVQKFNIAQRSGRGNGDLAKSLIKTGIEKWICHYIYKKGNENIFYALNALIYYVNLQMM